MKMEVINLNKERNVTLTAYIQQVEGEFKQVQKRPGIIVFPGGGYTMCSDREADPVAFAYLKAGYQAFILRYSVAEHRTWPNPLNDYEEAIELIKSKSDEWGVYSDKIAVVGFSAGGHLAAAAATSAKNRPQAAIIGYGAVGRKLTTTMLSDAVVPIEAVDNKTCPCFLFTSRTDFVVPVLNTVEFQKSLIENDISFESHIYAYGMHGYSTDESFLFAGNSCSRSKNWVGDSIEWLKDVLGDFGDGCMTAPKIKNMINGNKGDYLSLDCTYLHLKDQSAEALAVLEPIFMPLNAMAAQIPGGLEKLFGESDSYFASITMRDLAVEVFKLPTEIIDAIDTALMAIKNKI